MAGILSQQGYLYVYATISMLQQHKKKSKISTEIGLLIDTL
jgi:hypothetical protein